MRAAHREPAHHRAAGFAFGAVALEELEPGRRGVEQVAHLDPGSLAQRRRLDLAFLATVDREGPGVRLVGVPGRDGEARDRTDRGQGLAAEAERANVEQIVMRKL